MADYVEVTDYTDFFIDVNNIPPVIDVLKKEYHKEHDEEYDFSSGDILEHFGLFTDGRGNVVNFFLESGKETDLNNLFTGIAKFVRPGSRVVFFKYVLFGYEFVEENGVVVVKEVKYDITPQV